MRILGIFLQIILGLVFILSALTKLFPVEYLESVLVEQGVASWALSAYLARLLIAFEFLLGVFLLAGLLFGKVLLRTTLITLIFFTLYTGFLVLSGSEDNCGCFGTIIAFTPLESLLKNLILLAVNFFLLRHHYSLPARLQGTFAIMLIPVSVAMPFLLNPLASGGSEEVSTTSLPEGIPPIMVNDESISLDTGKVIVAILSPTCPHCLVAARKLEVMENRGEIPPVYVYFWGKEELVPRFFEKASASFPYAVWGDRKLLQLVEGRLPGIFVLEDGVIVRRLNNGGLTTEQLNGAVNH